MSPLVIAIIALAASAPQPLADFPQPSPSDISSALTHERFDDSCVGPGPSDGCPMINIYVVEVRKPHCSAAKSKELVPVWLRIRQSVVCRFESRIGLGGRPDQSNSGSWRKEQAVLYLTSNGWQIAAYVSDHP